MAAQTARASNKKEIVQTTRDEEHIFELICRRAYKPLMEMTFEDWLQAEAEVRALLAAEKDRK